jgi:hypothetical protein
MSTRSRMRTKTWEEEHNKRVKRFRRKASKKAARHFSKKLRGGQKLESRNEQVMRMVMLSNRKTRKQIARLLKKVDKA